MPILRPLIMMDKSEIMAVAERIETYPISILPYEDCCTLFVPKSPSTKPRLIQVEFVEKRLDWMAEGIEQAVRNTETIVVSEEAPQETDVFF
jgi:thiamine biosynthesis protein ThiI